MGIAALIHPLISLHRGWYPPLHRGWYPPLHRGWYNRAARKFTIMLGLDAPTLIARLFVLLTAFAVHEFAHAWTANRFGDDTPRLYGRLTLNPLAHLDVMGSLMLIFVGFGWAKPVPVNAYYLERRSPAALMWVSLAGPLSNLLMAVLAAIPFQLGLLSVYDAFGTNNGLLPTLPYLLFEFVSINLILMLFNLIPLYPLDGEKIAQYFFPTSWVNFLDRIRPYSTLIFIVVFFGLPYIGIDVFGWILSPAMNVLYNLLLL
jgi:Zn-dependent protease